MNNIYEPENDNDNVNDISIADLLIQDIDLKKNYNSRYKFYIELLKIYNKNPKIIKRIYTKLNAIKDLNNKEKKLLSELNYYNSINEANPGGKLVIKGGENPLDNYKESSFRDVLKRSFDMSNVSKLNKKIYKKDDDKEEETDNKIGDFNKQIDDYNDDDIHTVYFISYSIYSRTAAMIVSHHAIMTAPRIHLLVLCSLRPCVTHVTHVICHASQHVCSE